MITVGPHISIAGGFTKAGKEAIEIGANTFQFFTRNPRGGKAKKLDSKDVQGLESIMKDNNFGALLAHAPYTMNLCSAKAETREFARRIFKEDLLRLEELPCQLYNLHPGNHTGQGVKKGVEQILEILNAEMWEGQKVKVLLETMSGKGTEIGRSFEELSSIITGVSVKDKIGVCLDTCHVYSGGYDIAGNLEDVLEEFDRVIGLSYLKAIHLNDSMMPFKSHKDRHEKLGYGSLGKKAFEKIVNHKELKNLPFFLETPYDAYKGYEQEISWLRSL